MSLCKHCRKEAFDEEEQVCTRCGIVGDDVELKLDVGSSISFTPYERPPRRSRLDPLAMGLQTLDTFYGSQGDIKVKARKLFVSVHTDLLEKGKAFKSRVDVSTLAACCGLQFQRKGGNAVTIQHLREVLACSAKKVKKMSKIIRVYLADHPLSDEEEEIKIKWSDFSSIECIVTKLLGKVPEQTKSELVRKTILLTKLAASCWLVSGRAGEGVVVAAAYLCWKSLHPHQAMTLEKFCTTYGLHIVTARARVPELKSLLLKLGAHIPAVTENYVTRHNILYHLNYILENSESLRNDSLSGVYTREEMDKREFTLYRKSIVKPKPSFVYSADMNASDVEISDTEINSYIRTEEQVNFIRELKHPDPSTE